MSGSRERQRDGGFHYNAIARVLTQGLFLSAVTPHPFVWRLADHRNKYVRPKNTHWGKRKEARSRCIIVFVFVASSFDRKCKRARQRGDGTKPTLGSENVRWCVWRGNLWSTCV
jgi:hypothetical protein